MLNYDRAAKKAKTLWLKTKTEFTGNWHIDLDDQAIIVNAVAAELREAYKRIEGLELAQKIRVKALRETRAEIARLKEKLNQKDDEYEQQCKHAEAEIARLRAREQAYEFIQRTYDERENALGEAYAEIHNLRTELQHWREAAASVGQPDGHGWAENTKSLRAELAKVKP